MKGAPTLGGIIAARIRKEGSCEPTSSKKRITVYDREKAAQENLDMIAFLDQHEGARFLGLALSSADATASYLRSRGFDVEGPGGGTITPEVFHRQVFDIR
jgi:hypothetical protein